MATTFISRRLGAGALALSALALAGCATMGASTPEAAVEQRAAAYWKARQAADFEKAYALSTPAYRKARTAQQFRSQFGAGAVVAGAEVTKVTCEPEKCVARMKISVTPALLNLKVDTISTHVDEIWLLEDGQWWRYQEL